MAVATPLGGTDIGRNALLSRSTSNRESSTSRMSPGLQLSLLFGDNAAFVGRQLRAFDRNAHVAQRETDIPGVVDLKFCLT